jgi:hypothetical protein
MAANVDLSSLNIEQLRDFYVQLRTYQRGPGADEATVPASKVDDEGWLRRSIDRSLTAFDRDGRLGLGAEVGPNATPEERLAGAIKGYLEDPSKPVAEKDAHFMEYMAMTMYGHQVSLDGDLSNDQAALRSISEELERNRPAADIRAKGALNAAAARDQTVAADVAAGEVQQQTMALQGAMAALGYDTGPIDGSIDLKDDNPFGAHFAGKAHPADMMLLHNQEALQRHFGKNISEIRNGMFKGAANGDFTLTPDGMKTMEYLVQNTDLRQQVSDLLESGDPQKIMQAQSILRLSGVEGADDVRITGEVDKATAEAGIAYFNTNMGIGDRVFRFTHAPAGGPFRNDINTAVLKRGIIDGTITINEDFLPADFKADLEGLTAAEKAEEIALHLSDPNNMQAYNTQLQQVSRADLAAGLEEKMAGLNAEASRLALRGTLIEKFYAASTGMMSVRDFQNEFDMNQTRITEAETAKTLASAGKVDEGIASIEGRVNSTLASIEEKQLAMINKHLPAINRLEGFEGLNDREILAKLRTPEGMQEFDRATTGWGGANLRSTFVQGSQWRGLNGAYRQFAEIKDGIESSKPPAAPKPGGDHIGDEFRGARDGDLVSDAGAYTIPDRAVAAPFKLG